MLPCKRTSFSTWPTCVLPEGCLLMTTGVETVNTIGMQPNTRPTTDFYFKGQQSEKSCSTKYLCSESQPFTLPIPAQAHLFGSGDGAFYNLFWGTFFPFPPSRRHGFSEAWLDRVSQPWNYWHFGPAKAFLWGAVHPL